MEQLGLIIGLAIAGYLLGGVPFGVVISKAMGLPDPRTVGSKNVGFTNVLRVSGKPAGILTLIGDMGKGWVMGFAAMHQLQDEWAILVVALAPFLGHVFSPFLGFKGGCRNGAWLCPGCVTVGWALAAAGLDCGRGHLALLFRRRTDGLWTFSRHRRADPSINSVHALFASREWVDCDQT